MTSLIGLIAALALLIALTMRGMSLFIATPLCALLVALCGGIAPLPMPGQTGDMVSLYMGGFTGFIANWFFMFLLGSIFGKVMEDTGCADSIVRAVSGRLGVGHAALAVVLACAVLTYGGVSLFVVAFSVYPMAVGLFREADLPRRFIPAALSFGSVTFTMTSAGSPEIQNWIPIQHLGTTQYAGWQASIVVALFMAVFGQLWLGWMIKRAKARGERFEARDDDPAGSRQDLPNPWAATLPLLAVLGISFLLHERLQTAALIVALLSGAIVAALVGWRHQRKPGQALADAATGALIAIGNTAAVVGFGAVAKAAPAFEQTVQWMTHLPGGGLVGAAVAVSLIAAMTGSASGGQAIALPIIAPLYTAQGVSPDQLHRVVAISSGVLDSLPHNGYVVTTIRAICKDTHARAYPAVGALTVIVPLAGLILCIGLFAIGF
ncbi:MAG: GntP family permease [Ahniella sp.]|nr:GntP family permease [Ahniella sp.]